MNTPRNRRAALLGAVASLLAARPLAAQQFAATYVVPAGGFTMCSRDTRSLTVRVTNTGTATWTTDRFHLSYHWFNGPTQVVADGTRTNLPAPVPPGGSVSLAASVAAFDPGPSPAPPFTLKFDMVDEGVTWFSTAGSPTGDVSNVTVLHAPTCYSVVAAPPVARAIGGPHIDRCGPTVLRPGSLVLCTGSGFGAHGWKATLKVRQHESASPTVDLPIYLDRESSWRNDAFQVTVPPGLTGFKRGTATVSVSVQGVPSNELPVTVEPVLVLKWADERTVRNAACGGDASGGHQNQCGRLAARHSNSASVGAANGDQGRDRWTGALYNGWEFVEPLTFHSDHPGQATASGFRPPSASLDLTVDWHYDWGFGGARTGYSFAIPIRGPRDVPFDQPWD